MSKQNDELDFVLELMGDILMWEQFDLEKYRNFIKSHKERMDEFSNDELGYFFREAVDNMLNADCSKCSKLGWCEGRRTACPNFKRKTESD